jgi:hypothetical protein
MSEMLETPAQAERRQNSSASHPARNALSALASAAVPILREDAMSEQRTSKERIGQLIDYWTAKAKSHERWPEGQGLAAEALARVYADTISALRTVVEPLAIPKNVVRYKVQQDHGKYCLKGCDDGDLVDWSAYEALLRTVSTAGN